MNKYRFFRKNLIFLGLFFLLLMIGSFFINPGISGNAVKTRTDIRSAIERSLPFLEKAGIAWMEGRISIQNGDACVSCHQVPFGIWSQSEARARGILLEDSKYDDLAKQAVAFLNRPNKGRVMSWGPVILGLKQSEVDNDTSKILRNFLGSIVEKQQSEGYWRAKGQFPRQNRPSSESDEVATMWTILTLSSFDEMDESVLKSRERALDWVQNLEPGESNEWLLTRMLVEHKLEGPILAHKLLEQLLKQQNRDGGWSWLPKDNSNAFSTGQTLYALNLAGVPYKDSHIQNAVNYLLKTQKTDGTWFVDSNLTSRDGSDAKDYVYTYWGTAWATIGLARSLPVNGRVAEDGSFIYCYFDDLE